MSRAQLKQYLSITVLMICSLWACRKPTPSLTNTIPAIEAPRPLQDLYHPIDSPIKMRDYFAYMDSLVTQYSSDRSSYPLNEYHLAHANPWLINRLYQTDYYLLKEKGIVNKKQSDLVILRPNDRFRIPEQTEIKRIDDQLTNTLLDINLPEYTLRIIQDDSVLYKIPVRIGQERKKYLAMAQREVDLRTHTGIGEIVRINKNPAFINPANNHVYHKTTRDDGIRTDLPIIPWLEPAINGIRHGQLIHPTTNPVTLGKKSSNGCIGTRECDGWLIYYHAPVGTKVVIRNDRHIIDSQGDTILLPQVYRSRPSVSTNAPALPIALITEYTQ
jgi:L,D-transpeptidase ErfK/SrfK